MCGRFQGLIPLIVAAVSRPHHCDLEYQRPEIIPIPFESDGLKTFSISFRGVKGHGPE
jgi:hypothetical protein